MNVLQSRRRYALAANLDLLRAVGVRRAWVRLQADRKLRARLLERGPRVAEAMWRDAAAELGAEVRALAPGLLELHLDGEITRVRGQTTAFATGVATEVADDKPLAYRLLTEAGLPVPEHVVVDPDEPDRGRGLLERLGAPCVVKPARGSGGAGVTGEVHRYAQLRRALIRAWKFDPRALVERQIAGDTYRLLVLDGESLDVLHRPRPRVLGDGRTTIGALIMQEYTRRLEDEGPAGLKQLPADLDCLFTLERAGLSLASVLADGEQAVIHTATNYNGPGEIQRLDGDPPTTLTDPARSAAAALGVRLAGVDVVTSDPHRPLAETGGAVLEVNGVPALTHHYNVAEPKRVAVHVLRGLLQPTAAQRRRSASSRGS